MGMSDIEKPKVVQNDDGSITIIRPNRGTITIIAPMPIPRTVKVLEDGELVEGTHPPASNLNQ
jgi:hypothetical protein